MSSRWVWMECDCGAEFPVRNIPWVVNETWYNRIEGHTDRYKRWAWDTDVVICPECTRGDGLSVAGDSNKTL